MNWIQYDIARCKTAPEAYNLLAERHGTPSLYAITKKWDAWIGCIYKPQGKAIGFLKRLHSALTEVMWVLGEEHGPSESIQYMVFLNAVPNNRDNFDRMKKVRFKHDEADVMKKVESDFLSFEHDRRDSTR